MTTDDITIAADFATPQDVLIVCNAVDAETSADVGFYVNSTVLRSSCAWFASCIDDRPPDYEPGAVIRIAVDEPCSDMQVFLRMMHVGSASITSMRVTLPQVLYAIPRLMHRFGADRTLWRLLPTYLHNPWKFYGLDRLGGGYALRDNIWAVLAIGHNARDAKVWANTVGLGPGTRPPDPEWQFLWDPYTVPRSEITPDREILYRILLAAARTRARVGFVDFEYTDKSLILFCKKMPEFKIFFDLDEEVPVII